MGWRVKRVTTTFCEQSRWSRWIFVTLICITLLTLLYSYQQLSNETNDQRPAAAATATTTGRNERDRDRSSTDFVLDQPSCRIPRTEIMPAFFLNMGPGAWHTSWKPSCGYEKQLVMLEGEEEDNEVLRFLPTTEEDVDGDRDPPQNCCVSQITREDPFSDHGYKLSSCEPLRTSLNVHGKQMLVVQCGDTLNFEATIPIDTPAVMNKSKYWERKRQTTPAPPPPISVLLLAIDTVSRSHAYRSLPRTLDFMTLKMDFVDFQGYHSVFPSTLPNFMALLMGMTQPEVRRSCASDWNSTWDNCPFIWKEYDAANYVTMYVEDGDGWQTFNWGGQSGFQKEPTDYYLLPLFNSLRPLRTKHSIPVILKWMDRINAPDSELPSWGVHGPCTSNETIPQFLVRYTRRFLHKFSPNIWRERRPPPPPFFALSFLAFPFHNDLYTLPTMDGELLDLMRDLNENHKALLESTLIMVLSDHGDRFSFFHSESMEAYIERALPMLFVRVPEVLRQKFPEYAEALEWNAAHRLVTPFDLHHTLKHLLHLDSPKTSEEFVPVLHDRSSLFHRVGGSRTRKQLNLKPESCACNISLYSEALRSPTILAKLMPFVEKKLNDLVTLSGHANLCAHWTTGTDHIISARILNQREVWSSSGLYVLLKFLADPLQAAFEVKVRIWLTSASLWAKKDSEWSRAEIEGDFLRINEYGNQSSCIPLQTDLDKKMKKLCVCQEVVSSSSPISLS